mmetsp:Transcript_156/g.1199  ORF Transcript_156/g.1199 Transcript_156/m.1199 type:complete len:86 (-) Transcript_156:3408-3665(-)
MQVTDAAGFLHSLSRELASADKPVDTRRLAGLILKNALDAKDEKRKAELVSQWLAINNSVKEEIKASLLATLPAEVRLCPLVDGI